MSTWQPYRYTIEVRDDHYGPSWLIIDTHDGTWTGESVDPAVIARTIAHTDIRSAA